MNISPIDPTNGESLRSYLTTPLESIPALAKRARLAQKPWKKLGFAKRSEILKSCQREFLEHADEIAQAMHHDMGKPLAAAMGEVRYYAKAMDEEMDVMLQALQPEVLQKKGTETTIHHVPLGVAGLITPWNFPFGMPLTLLVPALSAGNTVLFKPSELALGTAKLIADLMSKHLPEGVLQLVVGGDAQGQAVVESPIDMIGFVGSRAVGKKIMANSSKNLKRLLLELGGNDAMIVGPGADLTKAADYAVRGALRNSGQVCCSVERIYACHEVVKEFTDLVAKRMAEVEIDDSGSGDGFLQIGPLASQQQLELTMSHLQDAAAKGAIIQGGERLERPGFYLKPALATGLSSGMLLMDEETFGPVIPIQEVASVDEAVDLTNSSRYGLTATLWMGDQKLAEETALEIEAGQIGVNRSFSAVSQAPWAGAKESGLGHTGGVSGMRHFLQPRCLTH